MITSESLLTCIWESILSIKLGRAIPSTLGKGYHLCTHAPNIDVGEYCATFVDAQRFINSRGILWTGERFGMSIMPATMCPCAQDFRYAGQGLYYIQSFRSGKTWVRRSWIVVNEIPCCRLFHLWAVPYLAEPDLHSRQSTSLRLASWWVLMPRHMRCLQNQVRSLFPSDPFQDRREPIIVNQKRDMIWSHESRQVCDVVYSRCYWVGLWAFWMCDRPSGCSPRPLLRWCEACWASSSRHCCCGGWTPWTTAMPTYCKDWRGSCNFSFRGFESSDFPSNFCVTFCIFSCRLDQLQELETAKVMA